MEQRVREHEEKREKIKKEMQAKYEASLGSSVASSIDKMNKIRDQSNNDLNERVSFDLITPPILFHDKLGYRLRRLSLICNSKNI